MSLKNKRSFTLMEILVALTLTGVIVLAVASVDVTSRRFLKAAQDKSRIYDEVKIVTEHIAKSLQSGIGDILNPGFSISAGGGTIEINQDSNYDGRFEPLLDTITRYTYRPPTYDIVYDPDISVAGDEEVISKQMIANCNFAAGAALNEVALSITSRKDPTLAASSDNPETILTSSIVLREMSLN
ncbi:MAG: prepilin-type N-terminal cleavage/methylation domain-containing protein [Candidatus Omnitrophica bacterium]|nr:prepilin-type N-terminal cleavage/methylation domain-containing protein [Candidatus Omnitrophota bacterium]